jgi:thymidylate kinase
LLVEFFGLPGAGKSSMSRHVAEILLSRGLAVDEVTYDIDHRHRRPMRAVFKVARILRYSGANPRKALVFSAGIAATEQATLSDLAKSALNWIYIASLASCERSDGRIVLLDQGLAQALWSIGFAARREAWLNLLDDSVDGVIGPDMVVYVRADLQTVRDRLARREPRVSRLERVIDMDDGPLRRAEVHSKAVVQILEKHGVAVLEVVNDNPDERILGAERIAGAITSMQEERRARSGAPSRVGSSSVSCSGSAAQDNLSQIAGQSASGQSM